jgi:hypothetical protein
MVSLIIVGLLKMILIENIVMSDGNVEWQAEASARLSRVPFFIRPFVKARVEKVARSRNITCITEALMLEIKQKEMPRKS